MNCLLWCDVRKKKRNFGWNQLAKQLQLNPSEREISLALTISPGCKKPSDKKGLTALHCVTFLLRIEKKNNHWNLSFKTPHHFRDRRKIWKMFDFAQPDRITANGRSKNWSVKHDYRENLVGDNSENMFEHHWVISFDHLSGWQSTKSTHSAVAFATELQTRSCLSHTTLFFFIVASFIWLLLVFHFWFEDTKGVFCATHAGNKHRVIAAMHFILFLSPESAQEFTCLTGLQFAVLNAAM